MKNIFTSTVVSLLCLAGTSACSDADDVHHYSTPEPLIGEWVQEVADENSDTLSRHFVFNPDGTYYYWTTSRGRKIGTDNMMFCDASGAFRQSPDGTVITMYQSKNTTGDHGVFMQDQYSLFNDKLYIGTRSFVRPSQSDMPWVPMIQMTRMNYYAALNPGERFRVTSAPISEGNHCRIVNCYLLNYHTDSISLHDFIDDNNNVSVVLSAGKEPGTYCCEFAFECEFTNDFFTYKKEEKKRAYINSMLIYTVRP